MPNSDARLRYGYIAALIAAAGIIAAVLLYGHTPTVSPHTTIAVQTSPTPAAAKLGVEITALRLSAAGYMLDLRYRIVDIKKAAALLDRKIAPYLIEQASGAKLMVPNTPKLGPLRQTRKPANNRRTNFIFFANPGRFIKAGDKVSLVVGDTKIDNLTVE
ncbi:MAG: hypothetical protein ABIR48_05745 [Gammaproteobacteria bacterium]